MRQCDEGRAGWCIAEGVCAFQKCSLCALLCTPAESDHAAGHFTRLSSESFFFRTCAVLPLFSPGHQNAPVYLTRLLREGCQELHPQDGASTAGSSTLCTRTLNSYSVLNPSGNWVYLTAVRKASGFLRMLQDEDFQFYSAAVSSDYASR